MNKEAMPLPNNHVGACSRNTFIIHLNKPSHINKQNHNTHHKQKVSAKRHVAKHPRSAAPLTGAKGSSFRTSVNFKSF